MIPLARVTLADGAYQAILESILSGTLRSGTELSENSLADDLNVSRTPVREALGRLMADGLVEEYERGRLRISQFSARDLEEIYGMRSLLESEAAGEAATRMTDAEIAALRREADALEGTSRNGSWRPKALEFDLRFHDAVAAACGNDRLRSDIARYRLLVRAFCRLTGSRENLDEALREHLAVLGAIEARDPDRARAEMKRHVKARLAAVRSRLAPEGR